MARGDFHVIPCDGAAWGVDLYRRVPGDPSFTLFRRSETHTCGTFNNRPGVVTHGACPRARIELLGLGTMVSEALPATRCSYYYARARASFQLPGDPATIEGAVLTSEVWQFPSCEH